MSRNNWTGPYDNQYRQTYGDHSLRTTEQVYETPETGQDFGPQAIIKGSVKIDNITVDRATRSITMGERKFINSSGTNVRDFDVHDGEPLFSLRGIHSDGCALGTFGGFDIVDKGIKSANELRDRISIVGIAHKELLGSKIMDDGVECVKTIVRRGVYSGLNNGTDTIRKWDFIMYDVPEFNADGALKYVSHTTVNNKKSLGGYGDLKSSRLPMIMKVFDPYRYSPFQLLTSDEVDKKVEEIKLVKEDSAVTVITNILNLDEKSPHLALMHLGQIREGVAGVDIAKNAVASLIDIYTKDSNNASRPKYSQYDHLCCGLALTDLPPGVSGSILYLDKRF